MVTKTGKELLGNRVVMAFSMPLANDLAGIGVDGARIAATDVQSG